MLFYTVISYWCAIASCATRLNRPFHIVSGKIGSPELSILERDTPELLSAALKEMAVSKYCISYWKAAKLYVSMTFRQYPASGESH